MVAAASSFDRRQLFLPVVLPHVRMLPECLIKIVPVAITPTAPDDGRRRQGGERPVAATV